MNKTFSIVLIFLFASFLVYSLTKQINESIKVGERLQSAADDVNKLQETNRHLKEQLSSVEQPEFVEKTARNKLNMAKPGETIVLIPQEAINQVLEAEKPPEIPPIVPNWQKWLRLFM